MATLWLYNNKSDTNKLNKNIVELQVIENVKIKEDTDQVNPVLILSDNINLWNANYIYISTFERYYYIVNKEVSQQRLFITCKCDPLMSFKKQINSLSVIADRASVNFDLYQADRLPIDNYKIMATKLFPHGFAGESYVLATAGAAATEEPEEEVTT